MYGMGRNNNEAAATKDSDNEQEALGPSKLTCSSIVLISYFPHSSSHMHKVLTIIDK